MWFVMGEEEITKPVKSLALSCSWHTLAEDMSAEKYETIHKALHTPTLKCYRETFKWKTSNKLQLRWLWHTALPWMPYHWSAYSSVCCLSQEEKQKTSLVFLYFIDRTLGQGRTLKLPWWVICGSEDYVTGTDTRLTTWLLNISAAFAAVCCLPTGLTLVSAVTLRSLLFCLRC